MHAPRRWRKNVVGFSLPEIVIQTAQRAAESLRRFAARIAA